MSVNESVTCKRYILDERYTVSHSFRPIAIKVLCVGEHRKLVLLTTHAKMAILRLDGEEMELLLMADCLGRACMRKILD